MKIAYADPPYIGQAKKHYDCEEIDQQALIKKLEAEYPDGWALSCGSKDLGAILPMVGVQYRVGAWCKPFCNFKPGVRIGYAWEPIIFHGGRKYGREHKSIRDYVLANPTMKRGVHGAKPEGFCFWLFEILGLEASDEFHDLFIGSGAVTRAWEKWKGRTKLDTYV